MPTTTVLTGPPGPIVEEPFFAHVVAWCADVHRAAHLLYVVPTARRRIEVENMILDACPAAQAICQAPVVTLDRFAQRLFRASETGRLISWDAATLVVEMLLNDSPRDFPALLGGRSTPFPGLVVEIVRSIRELKRYAVEPGRLAHDTDPKARDLGRLFTRYDGFLADNGWSDARDALRVVGERLRDPVSRLDRLADVHWAVFDGFVEFSPSEQPLVRALVEHADTTFVMDTDPACVALFPSLPDFAAGAQARRASSPLVHVARLAVSTDTRADARPRPPVALIEANTREDEVERVASRIKTLVHSGIPQRDVAVAVADLEQYAPLIEEIFPAHGLPYSIAHRPWLVESPVAAAALLLLETPAHDFERGDVVRLFRSPFVRFEQDGRAVEPGALEALARASRIFRGKNAWLEGLRARIALLEREPPAATLESDDEQETVTRFSAQHELRMLRALDRALGSALDLLDELREPRSACAYAQSLRRLMGRFGIQRRTFELLAAQAACGLHVQACPGITAVLDELEHVDGAAPTARDISLEDFIGRLRSSLASAPLGTHASPEGIEILDIPNAGERRSCVLFLLGLVKGAVPRRADPHALLGLATRTRLGLPGQECLEAQRQIELHRAIASASQRLFLCRPLYQDETRLLPPMMWERIKTALEPPPADTPSTPSSWRSALCDLARGCARVPPLDTLLSSRTFSTHEGLRAFAHAHDVEMKRRAALAAPTPYAGTLSAHLLDEVRHAYDREHQFSSHELETYVACPFRFFARWLLDLAPVEEPEEEIGPREKGNVLHAIFRRFYVEWWRRRGVGRIALDDRERAIGLLTAIARDELGSQPYSDFLWLKFLDRLLGSSAASGEEVPGLFAAFLDEEISSTAPPTACTPHYFELGFGRHEAGRSLDDNSRLEPVSILVGDRRILLRGIIDRIDTNEEARTFCVLDYKSGGTIPSLRDIREGLSLQLPIYVMAASEVLGTEYLFAAAGYFQTKDADACGKKQFFGDAALAREALRRKKWPPESTLSSDEINAMLARERDAIGRAVLGIETGRFAVTTLGDDKAGCRSCDYKHICRYDGITVRTFGHP
jgi:ATP-dependent helicase/DNAse subunit B